jgi:signal transduction histidine kinase
MKTSRSLRLRVALYTSLLAGIVLASFAALAWFGIRGAYEHHLDAVLRMELRRMLSRPLSADAARASVASLREEIPFEGAVPPQIELYQSASGELLLRTDDFPAGVAKPELKRPPGANALPGPPPRLPPPDANAERDFPPDAPPPDDPGHPPPPGMPPPGAPPPGQGPPRNGAFLGAPEVVLSTLTAGGTTWRIAQGSSPNSLASVAADRAVLRAEMQSVTNVFALSLPAALLLIALGAWWIAGRAAAATQRLARAMHGIDSQHLEQRLAPAQYDREFDPVIASFNELLARLERSFNAARRFGADAAHELKTPLAVMQGSLEATIAAEPDGSPTQAVSARLLGEVRRLDAIVRKLLLLAHADAGRLRIEREAIDWSAALRMQAENAAEDAQPLRVEAAIAPHIRIHADRTLIDQAVSNLIGNAIKYNAASGWIRIELHALGARAQLIVRNARDAQRAIDAQRLFERFWRGEEPSGQGGDGHGLGLALAREIARAHGGDCRLLELTDSQIALLLELPAQATAG